MLGETESILVSKISGKSQTIKELLENLHRRDLRNLGSKYGVSSRKISEIVELLLKKRVRKSDILGYPPLSELKYYEDVGVSINERLKAYGIITSPKTPKSPSKLQDIIRHELKLIIDPVIIKKIPKSGILLHGEIEQLIENRLDLFFPSKKMCVYTGPKHNIDVILKDDEETYYLVEVSYSTETKQAIGQLFYYRAVFKDKAKISKIKLVLATNKIDKYVERVCKEAGIILIDVSPKSDFMKSVRTKRTKIQRASDKF